MMFLDNVIEDERLHLNISANIMLSLEAQFLQTRRMRFAFYGLLITKKKTRMNVILRARRLSSKLLKQGYLVECLKSSFRKFYDRYRDLIQQYEVSLSPMLNDILTLD